MYANYNCPISICYSAIIYIIRCLLGADVPLNEGCLVPGYASSLAWGMGGKDPEMGKITPGWNYGESISGSINASYGYYAEDAVRSTNTRRTDFEVVEKRAAVAMRDIEARVPLKFSILSDRRVYRPYGIRGGGPGEKGVNLAYIFNEEGQLGEVNLGGKAVIHLQPGESIQIDTPGGGAFGTAEGESGVNGGNKDFHQAYV
ncbi:5-oxoprolinase [Dactylonectria estremocensis]|uniref:5-oxoprolinase n=1 Tax=Dactylonectria estremocensis TaxID=1079267 RepID=A0A9P9DA44_9HYPO|nr:5-oxoprolinase [Dactylonectria estremocensis]